jgi:hypothetical protein
MIKKIVFCLCIGISLYSQAQQSVSIQFGQSYARFRYIDSNGNIDENLTSDVKGTYAINYRKDFKGLFVKPSLGYNHLGATSSFNNQKLDWSLHYANIALGVGYQFNLGKINPYLGCSGYYAYLYKASQTIGVNYYNLLTDNVLSRNDLGVNTFVGVNFKFSEANTFFIEFNQLMGMNNLETNQNNSTEKLFNRAFAVMFGISFNLSKTE